MTTMFIIIFAILVIFLFISFVGIDNKIDNLEYKIDKLEKEIEKNKEEND